MKTTARTATHPRVLLLVLFITISGLFSLPAAAQTFVGFAGTPADNGSLTGATATITPPGSMQAGDLVIIYAHYRNTSGNLTINATGGQSWTSETQYNAGNQRTRIFWCTFDGTWTANPSVSRSGSTAEALSAFMYVYRPSLSTNTWKKHIGPNNANTTSASVTITGPTTTVNNTVTMGFWAAQDDVTWGSMSGTGWTKSGLGTQQRNTGGNDQSHTAAYNIQSTAGSLNNVLQARSGSSLTTATSVISFYESAPNDLCADYITLNSSTSCTTTSGNLFASSISTTNINAPDCSGGLATYDVWYRFTAQTTNPTITLSNVGLSLTGDIHLQLLSNNCGSNFTSYFCGTTSIAANYLTPGTIYYIRVYTTGALPASPIGNEFDICITDPVAPTPPNDECANAANLSVAYSCYNVPGDIRGATPSAVPLDGSCAGPLVYDVWYKFTATTTSATTTLGSIGANFVNPRIEIFSGNCGSLTSIFCGTSPLAATGLTIGDTYYVRVYSNTTPIPNGNSRFNICLTSTQSPVVRYGNSYVNVSKKTTGGVVEPGDTLEIRMTINHTNGSTMNNLRYVDNIPTHTAMLTGLNDSLRVITNEGLVYKRYSLTAADDAGTYLASPPAGQYNVRMNLGFGSSNPGIPPDNSATNITTTTGTMLNTNYPRGGGNLLFATAYRVVVTGVVGDTITINPAQFIYRTGGSDVTLTANSYKILISEPLSLCTNSIGVNNATEYGGTFGTGTTLNRPNDLTIPIAGYNFLNNINNYNHLNDGSYSIVKNTSPRISTNPNARFRRDCGTLDYDDPLNCSNRMHNGHWYIDGDHTGTNNAAGNLPRDETSTDGYMLMVNADYVASDVFVQTINNLCPNTYYEFSAWFKNICPTCGADSLGQSFQGTVTAPLSGYPGVYPNLSFALDGLDYYNTGEIDTVGWLKKGFVFRTGPTQTNATFSIRNNSQGGGGNDWVMDDIAVATCLPTMRYAPTINPLVCEFNPILLSDTISSYFKNYTTFKWQRSVDNGLNWSDVTGVTTLADTNYYITNYTVPPAHTTLADSGDLYRVVVATTVDNLSDPNCNISEGTTITLNVIDCDPVLAINLLNFNGRLVNEYSNLSWTTSREDKAYTYVIEKSTDQLNFTPIGNVTGNHNPALETNQYSFIDPSRVTGKVWYRIAILTSGSGRKYSRIINLSNYDNKEFGIGSIINPFDNQLFFEINSTQRMPVNVYLMDIFGKVVVRKTFQVNTGVNSLNLENTSALAPGVYALRIEGQGTVISKKVVKKD